MGVSLTSLYLSNFKSFTDSFTVLCKYLIDKLKFKDDHTYVLLHNARAQCLDYTYKDTDKLKASKIDYPMFNIDLIWFLENLLYYNVDLPLDNKILKSSISFKTMLLPGSWVIIIKKIPWDQEPLVVMVLLFVSRQIKQHAEESILKDNKIAFFKTTGWRELLKLYYNYKFDEKKSKAKAGPTFKGLTLEKSLAENQKRLIFENQNIEKIDQLNLQRS